VIDPDGTKRCPKCGERKHYTMFFQDKSRTDGRTSSCKQCQKLMTKRWRAANRELVNAGKKRWRERHTDVARAGVKAWTEAHKEQATAQQTRWHKAHKERGYEWAKRWAANNPDAVKAIDHNRRARKRAGGVITARGWKELREALGNKCLCCGATAGLTLDHITPLSLGGLNITENLQVLCGTCNDKKWIKTGMDYRPYPFPMSLSPTFHTDRRINAI